ncbi:MAG: hypothetical protein LBM28_07550 [Oscillospiraceae bacterium]|jgi:hypothetical protein|nr:hypothetical protein [Oscillospiraceae bacterium]
MANFCNRCGQPLPEDGVCPCTQAPAAYPATSQSGALQEKLKQLPALSLRFFKNPVLAIREAVAERDMLSGLLIMAFSVIATLLATLFFALRVEYGGFAAGAWIVTAIFAPLITFALTAGALFLLLTLAKKAVDFKAILAAVGVGALLPACLTLVGAIATLIAPDLYGYFGTIITAAWVIITIATVAQVFNLKMTLPVIITLIVLVAVQSYAVNELNSWYVVKVGSAGLEDIVNDWFNFS